MYKFKRMFAYMKILLKMLVAEIAGIFARRRRFYRNLWIVSERGIDARDNGFHFFKYLRTVHPEINAVYIISKDSPDRSKVSALGNTVEHGSFRHYLCYVLAMVKISTHIDGYAPDILFFHKFRKIFPDKAKKIFLQHGIIMNDIKFCHADQADLDMFVCSALPEFKYIDKTFGHKKGVLQLTGLCRYDNLRKAGQPTRRLLFMPTWRVNLKNCSKRTFLSSDYFKKYESFLNSEKLAALLEDYDYELVFYPHFEVHRFLDCFHTDNPRVHIADFKSNDVQQLLIQSDLLITDYSSVLFDYGYMRKPIVCYQYDEAEFRAVQYKKGYFDYRRDGFGDVVKTEAEVIASIRHILENDLRPDDVYLERMNAFYKFNDTSNCQRVYDAICRLLP